MGHGILEDADDGTDLSQTSLPAPGTPHSLSHNKDIELSNNSPPAVTASGSEYVYEGSVGTLTGTAPNSDTLTYAWTHNGTQSLGITIADYTALSTTFEVTGDVESDVPVTFTLTVSDGTPSPVLDSVDVIIQDSSGAFITTWETGNSQTTVRFSIDGANPVVDWGDGSERTSDTGTISHTYAEAGKYRITVDGSVSRLDPCCRYAGKLLRYVDQWGDIEWSSMQGMFRGASNMVYRAGDTPNLSDVSRMDSMFRGASAFNADLSGWDVSSVTDMSSMFRGASTFNSDLSSWDVSAVTDMGYMFRGASSFNGDISSWNVSKVTNTSFMFNGASSFNGDISGWDVSSVTDMSSMFRDASSFNGDISSWNVSKVTHMGYMFRGASSFNGDISGWDVSSVKFMISMFNDASAFNSDLSDWDVSAVVDMGFMFDGASSFNSDLSGWDVSAVLLMNGMFDDATSFEQNLGSWYVVPADTVYDAITETTLVVTDIAAQNSVLDGHSPSYGIGTGDDSALFNMAGSDAHVQGHAVCRRLRGQRDRTRRQLWDQQPPRA